MITKEQKNVPITNIKPYWRNPKKGTNVELVKDSILKFGYNSPIIVDENLEIIIGHSRYKALLELGYTDIDIIVLHGITTKQAKQYRIIDNKVSEHNQWDMDALKIELREIDIPEMEPFFEFNLDSFVNQSVGLNSEPITDADINQMNTNLKDKFHIESEPKDRTNIKCPYCFKEFKV